ncbi:MAG: FAD-dependent oxidoreductase [Verrucomicrobia bacterium]|nr:FAD-dependent oxidoreductase [Verrucomicrobiota bacterium]
MNRRHFLKATAAVAAVVNTGSFTTQSAAAERGTLPGAVSSTACDIFVYGSTPGGLAAAIEAARRGCKVVLACPQKHPGGMTASGLSTTDAVRPELFGGLVAEFIAKVREEYRRTLGEGSPQWQFIKDGWFYEPSVAERVFDRMLEAEAERLQFWRGHHLVTATVRGDRVMEVELEKPTGERVRVTAKTFIDGTYEGDLAAAARVPYRVGREGRDEHGESLAGIHYMNWRTGQQIQTPDTGEPSPAIQAFCARCIFTTDKEKLVPFAKPAAYEQHLPDLLPLLDDFATRRVTQRGLGTPLPGRKFQLNGSIDQLTSLNCPGASWTWPEAARHHRARLEKFHLDHAASYAWFLQKEPRVPEKIRALWKTAGLHRDEFADHGHWPWQIYVRQGRRIEGRARVTQHNFTVDAKTGRTPRVAQAIAIGEHSFDVHPCHDRRYAVEGFMEGVLWYPKKAFGPAQPGQVAYGAMLPKKLNNLLVPVALSSTHLAMSVLRMEPLWMTTGQIAGLAAAVAKDKRMDVANLDPNPLPRELKIKVEPHG